MRRRYLMRNRGSLIDSNRKIREWLASISPPFCR
jgi:hypothetical protein